MSNSYTQFCERIPTETEEEQEFVINLLSGVSEDGEELEGPDDFGQANDEGAACDTEKNGLTVIVSHSDSGDADRVADVVCAWQKKFNKTDPWILSYANICDKKIEGCFGGGAVLCCRGEQIWTSQISLIDELRKKMEW